MDGRPLWNGRLALKMLVIFDSVTGSNLSLHFFVTVRVSAMSIIHMRDILQVQDVCHPSGQDPQAPRMEFVLDR